MSTPQNIQANFLQSAAVLSPPTGVTPVRRTPPDTSGAVDPPEPFLVGALKFRRGNRVEQAQSHAEFLELLEVGY